MFDLPLKIKLQTYNDSSNYRIYSWLDFIYLSVEYKLIQEFFFLKNTVSIKKKKII